jgi:hypothetical protein
MDGSRKEVADLNPFAFGFDVVHVLAWIVICASMD